MLLDFRLFNIGQRRTPKALVGAIDNKKPGPEPGLRTTLSLRQLSSGGVAEGFGRTRLEGLYGGERDLLGERRQFLGLLG
jgi:hypothetical protein